MDPMVKHAAVTLLISWLLAASACRAGSCGGGQPCNDPEPRSSRDVSRQATERPVSVQQMSAASPRSPDQRKKTGREQDSGHLAEWMGSVRDTTDNGVSSWACWGMPGPPSDARVLATDNRANVHVISHGAEDGVQPGFTYIVSRGGESIGTIRITDVQAKQSAGRAIEGISKGAIRRGDTARIGK